MDPHSQQIGIVVMNEQQYSSNKVMNYVCMFVCM